MLFFTFATLFSCESTNTETRIFDPIIGTWRLTSMTLDGKESDTRTACEKRSTSTFQEKGTGKDNNFSEDNFGNCNKNILNFSWKNIDNAEYSLDNFKIKIEFLNNNNTYKSSLNIKTSDSKEVVAISTYSRI